MITSSVWYLVAGSNDRLPALLSLRKQYPDASGGFFGHRGHGETEWFLGQNFGRPGVRLFRFVLGHQRTLHHSDDQQFAKISVTLFMIRPRRFPPPLDLLKDVSPSQSAKSRPVLNWRASPMAATLTNSVIGPTPGIRISHRASASSRACCSISLVGPSAG